MIRKFEIWNEKYNELQGMLFYDTEKDEYSMKARKSYKGMRPDIFFNELGKQSIVDVPDFLVMQWVRGRVFPPNRQGVEGMLEEIGLPEYDLFKLLLRFEGRCQMDSSYLKEVT